MQLDGRVAVITGGASGIGLATGRALAAQGCRLVLADVEKPALDRAVEELSGTVDVLGVPTDVSDKDAVDRLAELTDERFGSPDIVFLNAGVGGAGPVAETSHDEWRWVMGVNLWGPIHGVEAFLPRMLAGGRDGHLLLTSSFAGLVPNLEMGPYCVTKYGVMALAEVLHKELRDTPLGVSVLCPMRLETNIGRAARNRPAELGGPESMPDVDTTADPSLAGRMLPPEALVERVMAALGTDRLYVFTHEESRAMIARRFARIDSAFD